MPLREGGGGNVDLSDSKLDVVSVTGGLLSDEEARWSDFLVEIEREGNGDLGYRKIFIMERAGKLMRDEEARENDIFRIKKEIERDR